MMNGRFGTRLLEITGVTLSVFVISSKCAHAYIDPGTGSYVLQAAVASILAAAFVFRSALHNIKEAICKRFAKRTKDG
jgi:hypothetical protein